jgi:hypothetical protein
MRKKCVVCGKGLSMYNQSDRCFCHQPGMVIYDWLPVTQCTGYRKTVMIDSSGVPVPQPGEDKYNDMAFTQTLIGTLTIDPETGELTVWSFDE